MSHGLKMASANLEDQTLHLTVRLQAGEEEEQEEEQDEEIGGLINSDGEVVEWDASKSFIAACLQHSHDLCKQYTFVQGTMLTIWVLEFIFHLHSAIYLTTVFSFFF